MTSHIFHKLDIGLLMVLVWKVRRVSTLCFCFVIGLCDWSWYLIYMYVCMYIYMYQ